METEEIENFVFEAVTSANGPSKKHYDILVKSILTQSNENLLLYIKTLKKLITHVSKEHEALIGIILKLDWELIDQATIVAISEIILDLISAKTYYLKACVKSLTQILVPKREVQASELDHLKVCFEVAHKTIEKTLQIAPISLKFVLEALKTNFPYLKKSPFIIEYYALNLLQFTLYAAEARETILGLLIDKMLTVDVQIVKSIDDDQQLQFEADPDPNTTIIDKLMLLLFTYFRSVCFNDEQKFQKKEGWTIFRELIEIFSSVILKTQQSSYVQFIIFYTASFSKQFYTQFIEASWKKIEDPNEAVIMRESAAGYLASFLARANFVDTGTVWQNMTRLSKWCLAYINVQDSRVQAEVSKHRAFYSACQALFYLFVYHHKPMLELREGLEFAKSLNLIRIVTSRLNPLKFCLGTVVKYFARVTRMYEVVFCYSIIERNNRNNMVQVSNDNVGDTISEMDMFFPFDPYNLPSTKAFVKPLYMEWKHTLPDDDDSDQSDADENNDSIIDHNISSSFDMMCVSPGFQLLHHQL